jgi:hypothetical protein
VKSVKLDSWTPEQIQFIRERGNKRGKELYEHPGLPVFNPSDHQSVVRRIKAKYVFKGLDPDLDLLCSPDDLRRKGVEMLEKLLSTHGKMINKLEQLPIGVEYVTLRGLSVLRESLNFVFVSSESIGTKKLQITFLCRKCNSWSSRTCSICEKKVCSDCSVPHKQSEYLCRDCQRLSLDPSIILPSSQ